MKKNVFSIAFIFTILFSFSKNELRLDTLKYVEIFDMAEVNPTFPEGMSGMLKFINRSLIYPRTAQENKLEGKVIVKFYVDIDGTIKNPVVLKDGVGGGAADEAIRIVKSMPKWIPGSQKGKLVRVYRTIPITFKLNDDSTDQQSSKLGSTGQPSTFSTNDMPKSSIVRIVDAEVTGGEETIKQYQQSITSKIKKTKEEKDKKITVKVSFIINENGSVSDATIVEKNTEDKSILQKILDGVNKMPKWKPATFKDKPISSSKILTFEF